MYCIVFYCVSILFLNISFCGPTPTYPQPDLYIIKINKYSNIQTTYMYVHTYVYILSLIIIILSIIYIHTYTYTHAHTCIHSHSGAILSRGVIYVRGSFIIFLYYPNFFKKGLGNSKLLEYSISIRNN